MLSASTSNSCAMGEDGSSPDSSGFIVGAANPSATDATAGASAGVGAASASADGGGDDGGGAAGAAAAAAAAGGDWGELEGFDELDEDARRHHQAFYNDLIPHVNSQAIHTRLFHKRKYLKILEFFKKVQQGMKQRQLFLEGYTQAYNWYDRYDVFTRDNGTDILVEKPNGKEPNELLDVATWKQVTYYERLFKDLAQIHNKDHSKGGTFYKIVHEYHPSVPRTITAMFCKTCPYCLGRLKGKKPAAAGVVPNLTEGGFNSCGQIELIDFQPQKDGKFRFLLCYIDHGVKKISCAPLVSKRARTVAWALYKIFADQGAPDGLLTGTGGKHSDSAMDNNFRRVDLSSKVCATRIEIESIVLGDLTYHVLFSTGDG